MKILKKFLIVFLFSFLFIINAKADTNSLLQFTYSDNLLDLKEQYSSDIETINAYLDNMVANNTSFTFTSGGSTKRLYISNGYYGVIYDLTTFNTNNKIVYFQPIVQNDGIYNHFGNFYSLYAPYAGSLSKFQFYERGYKFQFTFSNNTISSVTYVQDINTTYLFPKCVQDADSPNCVVSIDNFYYNLDYATNSATDSFYLDFNYSGSSTPRYDLLVGDTTYQYSYNTIPYKEFISSFMPESVDPLVCSRTQVLGFVSGVNDFTINIKGNSNALDYPIRGRFTFDYPKDSAYSSSDFNVDFIDYCPSDEDCEVTGSYELVCPSDSYYCYIDYSYNYIDDIDTDVSFGFNVSTISGVNMPSYMHFYNCFHNDAYYNITYSYTNSSGGTISNDNILGNFLQDGSLPDTTGLADTSLIPSGPIDSILTLPLNIMNSLLSTLNSSTCNPLVIPIPFSGGNLILPCISTLYSKITGLNVFLNWFSGIFSAFLLYKYLIYLYKWVDDTLTFRENNHFGGF